MAQPRGIAENRFGVEIDGISDFRASKVSGGGEKQTTVGISFGNDPYKQHVRGSVEPEDVSVTMASGRYDQALRELHQWFGDYYDGINAEPRSARYIVYDELGSTPVETYELQDCVPVSITPDNRGADGNGAAMVTVIIKPRRVRRI